MTLPSSHFIICVYKCVCGVFSSFRRSKDDDDRLARLFLSGCSPWSQPICLSFRPFIISSVINSGFLHFLCSLHLCLPSSDISGFAIFSFVPVKADIIHNTC